MAGSPGLNACVFLSAATMLSAMSVSELLFGEELALHRLMAQTTDKAVAESFRQVSTELTVRSELA